MMFRMRAGSLIFFILMALLSSSVRAHEPGDGQGHHEHTGTVAHQTHSLVLPLLEGSAKPWSDQPILNHPQRFQFAVVTDRTGGHRPGVWMHGVRGLNLLRPEFVVSVGDLIEGYTEDLTQIEAEWQEFLGFIDQLQMKFFFVAGNHDVTNPTMHRVWREHFGREWYSFDYKGVHFVCLSSEDPTSHLGEEQLAWAKEDLEKHRDARWTFVFLHKPLWTYAEREMAAGNEDPTNWKKLEAALGSRPHTVFAGHVHHYVQYQRNGHEYYHLATTGGGSRLRGEPYGEFDHITWVTMEEDGPRIANIRLEGVLAPDVVTEDSIRRFREFLEESKILIEPVLVETSDHVQSAEFAVTVANKFDDELLVDARIGGLPLNGLTLDPESFSVSVLPHKSRRVVCRFDLAEPLPFEQFQNTILTATIRSGELVAEVTAPVTIDRRHVVPAVAVELDGNLQEWSGGWMEFASTPPTNGAAGQWQGAGDGFLRFRMSHDEQNIYLGGEVSDDTIVVGRDRLYFGIDARRMEARLAESRLGEHCYTLFITPNGDRTSAEVFVQPRRGELPAGEPKVAIQKTDKGYTFELALPATFLTEPQNGTWKSLQLNATLRDVDEEAEDNLYLLWRPSSDGNRRNSSYAHFFRAEEMEEMQ